MARAGRALREVCREGCEIGELCVRYRPFVKGSLMINLRVTMVFVLGCFVLVGCAGPGDGPGVGVGDGQHVDAGGGDNGPVEVREQFFPDGSVSTRIEGRLDSDGNFIAHGLLTNFWATGQKKSTLVYVHGMRHGPKTAWYQSGQVWTEGSFVNGREDGTWTTWFPSGRQSQQLHFDHGAWHGMHTEWHPNGQKKMQVEWVRGKLQGMQIYWDEKGQIARQIEYVDDVPQP